MKISEKIECWDKSIKILIENLWKQSDDSFSLFKIKKHVFFIKSGLIVAIISLIISCGLAGRELIQGDYQIYGEERIGAICRDGWESFSIGSGTCSHHGGVDYWKYPLVNYHYANPNPYYIAIAVSISFLLIFSIFNRAFRLRLIVYNLELFYWLITILYLLLNLLFSIILILSPKREK